MAKTRAVVVKLAESAKATAARTVKRGEALATEVVAKVTGRRPKRSKKVKAAIAVAGAAAVVAAAGIVAARRASR
ncbi:MAG TPA: hypothetical protein VIY56_02210 [Vicinamibacterales bacterium]